MLKKLPQNTKKQLNKQRWSALQFSSCSRVLVSVCSFNFFFFHSTAAGNLLISLFSEDHITVLCSFKNFLLRSKRHDFFSHYPSTWVSGFHHGHYQFKKTALCSANLYDENITLFNLKIMLGQKNYIQFVFLFRSVSKGESFRDKYVLLRVNVMLKIIYVHGNMHCFPQGPWNLSQ